MFDFFWGVKEVKEGREGKDKCFGRPRCMHCYCTLLLYFFFVVKETGDKEIRQLLQSIILFTFTTFPLYYFLLLYSFTLPVFYSSCS